MIKRFGSLYAGHVDLDDIGFAGTPVNDRWQSDEHLASVFDKTTAIAQAMDRAGFDVFWLAEHHFQREGTECIPNILMLGLHLANVTERIKFGSAFNITPMWHPLRLAEDYATVDHLTKGRVIFGIGRGYHTREVETFGAPLLDNDANRELFEEQVDIIFKAFNEPSFSHRGKHYDIPARVPFRGYELEEITLVPRPLNLPVECWQPIVSGSQRGLDFMTKHGIKGLIGSGITPGGDTEKQVLAWRDALARAGRDAELGEDLTIGVQVHLADTEEQGIKEATSFYEENLKTFGPLGLNRNLSDEQIAALGSPATAVKADLPTLKDSIEKGAWACGPPELIIEKLMVLQDLYPGLELVNTHVGASVGVSESLMLEQIEWFGTEVIPDFKGAVPSAD